MAQLLTVCESGGEEEEEEVTRLLQNLNLYPIYSTHETTHPTNEPSGQTLATPPTSEPSGQTCGVLNQLYGGVSPLHVASEHRHPGLVNTLLEHGADPTLK